MKILATELPGVLTVVPSVFDDDRGYFLETWNAEAYRENGFPDVSVVQSNHSRSSFGVLRGLHYQQHYPQGKLIQVIRGAIFDVAVDIRNGSPNFGQWTGQELSDENHLQFWIPPGFAHGFCVLSEIADITYHCSERYRSEDDAGIIWNDPDINVRWPIPDPILSDKDRRLPSLADAASAKLLNSLNK